MALNILFLDAFLARDLRLMADLASNMEVVVLDSRGDGLQQIQSHLLGRQGLDAIHIVSHARAGELILAGERIAMTELEMAAVTLANIGGSLAVDGDLLLYGCDLGRGQIGEAFLTTLARLTGADVAASEDATGAAILGGNAILERATGSIKAEVALTAGLLDAHGLLLDNQAPLLAPAPALDARFAGDGVATTDFATASDIGYALAIQADGKVLVAGQASAARSSGDFILARYQADGALDANFGTGGKVVTEISGVDAANAVALLADGKILAAGVAGGNFALARYLANGALDTSFSGDGKLTTNFGNSDVGHAMAVQPDGKILVGGASGSTLSGDFALARYNVDGTLDTSFSGDGLLTHNLGVLDAIHEILLLEDGRIQAVGASSGKIALARYLADGALDLAFGVEGQVITSIAGVQTEAYAAAFQADGNLLVAGKSGNDLAVARYMAGGALDPGFGVNGIAIWSMTAGADLANALALQPDGKILVAGHGGVDSLPRDILLARLDASGNLDPTFSDDGMLILDLSAGNDTCSDMALMPDGALYLAGASNGDLALLRLRLGLLDQRADEDSAFSFSLPAGLFSDPDADPLNFAATRADGTPLPGWLHFDPVNQSFAGTPDNAAVGALDILVRAGDPAGLFAVDVFRVTVSNTNDAPFLAEPLADLNLAEDAPFTYVVPATAFQDIDPGEQLSFAASRADGAALPAWLAFDPATRTFSGTPDQEDVGEIDLRVHVIDSGGETASDVFRLSIANSNDAPRLVAAGALDPGFGGGGVLRADFGGAEQIESIVVQADGKLLAAGHDNIDFLLARFLPDGGLDTSFAVGGQLRLDFGGDDQARAIVLQADGKILVAGNSGGDFAIARLLPDGALDTSFNGTGGVIVDYGMADRAHGIALRPDGDILLAGESTFSGNAQFALLRFNPDGSAKAGFGNQGRIDSTTSVFSGYNDVATGLALQADGGIVLAGYSGNPYQSGYWINGQYFEGTPVNNNFALIRYLDNGALDPAFSGDGRLVTDLGSNDDRIQDLALQADGKIVVAGYKQGNGGYDYSLARYSADGALDPTFDTDGWLATHISASDFGQAVTIQADGRILVAGQHLLRYNGDGSLDVGFDADGWLATGLDARDLVLQADGRIVVAGTADGDFALARYLSGGIANQKIAAGGAIDFTAPSGLFQDQDGDALTFSASLADGAPLPDWLHFDPATLRFHGSPSGPGAGRVSARLIASDPHDLATAAHFKLTPTWITQGGTGNDHIGANSNTDTLAGGPGDDIYSVLARTNVITELPGEGNDTVRAPISWTLAAHLDNLELTGAHRYSGTGNALDNTLTGNAAGNILDGGTGADTLIGGAGNDVYVVDNANDTIQETGADANDSVRSWVDWTLGDNLENLVLLGTKSLNGSGNDLNNTLTGNGAANVLNGGGGNDLLDGASGNDTLSGGTGADTFAFSTPLNALRNIDTITDFVSGTDRIQLSPLIFRDIVFSGSPGTDAFIHLGASAQDADDRILYDQAASALSYDADGTGVMLAVRFATLLGSPALVYNDFYVG